MIGNKETFFSMNQNSRFLLQSSISLHERLKRPNPPAKALYKLLLSLIYNKELNLNHFNQRSPGARCPERARHRA